MNKRGMLKALLAVGLLCGTMVFAEGTVACKGNEKTKVYHLPACRFYAAKNSTVEFKSEADAQTAGYKPCKKCATKKDEAPQAEKKEKKEKPAEKKAN